MYGDQILNTEMINESLSNRQSAKMLYLQKENEQLQEENDDLKEALKLNKEALRIAYSATLNTSNTTPVVTPQRSKVISQSQQASTTAGTITISSSAVSSKQTSGTQNTTAEDIVIKLTRENERLLEMLNKSTKERNKAQSIALLQEQISEENSNFFQEQIAEKEDKIKELRMMIQDKEFVIQEFEKAKGYYDYGQNVLVRVREITTPNDQSMKLHNELEQLKEIIAKLSEENHRQSEKILLKEEYLRVLKQEILKLRLVILNPVNYQKMRGFLIKNFAEKGDEDADMCAAFYNEVGKQQAEELAAQQLREQQQYQKEISERQHNPLRPVRGGTPGGQQQYYQQQQQVMMTQPSQQQNQYGMMYSPTHTMPNSRMQTQPNSVSAALEKSAKLEENLKKLGKLYRKEIENNNILVQKIEEIMKECDQCFQNNELLIQSNFQFQAQVDNLHNQVLVYKYLLQRQFYQQGEKNQRRTNSVEQRLDMAWRITQQGSNNNNHNQKGVAVAEGHLQGMHQSRLAGQFLDPTPRAAGEVANSNNNNANKQGQDCLVNVSILDEDDPRKQQIHDLNKHQQANNLNNNNIVYPIRRNWESIRYDLIGKNITREDVAQLWQDTGDINSEANSLTKEQAKIYLLNLAKDFYVNSNIKSSGMTRQVLKQIEIGGYKTGIITLFKQKKELVEIYKLLIFGALVCCLQKRTRRSLSDPLDYVINDEEQKYTFKNQLNLNEILKKDKINFNGNNNNNHNEQEGANCETQQEHGRQQQQQQGNNNNPNSDDEIRVNYGDNNTNNIHNQGLFNVDMSVIVDTKSAQRGKNNNQPVQKKVHQIQVDASFISNDGEIEDYK